MQNDIERLLKALPVGQPPTDMFARIALAKEERSRLKSAKRQAAAFGAGIMTLGAAMSIYWNMFIDELAKSSFLDYARVLVTDYDMAILHWKTIVLSLVESLPLANAMAWSLMLFLVCGLINVMLKILPRYKMRSTSLVA